jgi:membrane associated rhomboid family serine protease
LRPPQSWTKARATLAIAAVTALAWIVPMLLGRELDAAVWAAFIPARLDGAISAVGLAPVWLTPLTATLVHGNFVHLAFNLLMLLFCGRAVEAILGARGIVILYVVSAYVAAAAMFLSAPDSTALMIGASGAVSGVFGAYALLFSRNRVNVAHPLLARWLNVAWMGAAWIVLQLMFGFVASGTAQPVAVAAHIGGFFAGFALTTPLLLLRYRRA